MSVAYSHNNVPIRFPDTRWQHIMDNKPYMLTYDATILETVEQPDWILRGHRGSLIAIRSVGKSRYLHVVYREVSQDDGFVITAYVAHKFNHNTILWSRNS